MAFWGRVTRTLLFQRMQSDSLLPSGLSGAPRRGADSVKLYTPQSTPNSAPAPRPWGVAEPPNPRHAWSEGGGSPHPPAGTPPPLHVFCLFSMPDQIFGCGLCQKMLKKMKARTFQDSFVVALEAYLHHF